MSEQERMDHWLNEALSTVPRPELSPRFDDRIARRIRPRRLTARGRVFMALYTAVAAAVSIWTMRSAAIDWSLVAVAIVIPLLVVAAVGRRAFIVVR